MRLFLFLFSFLSLSKLRENHGIFGVVLNLMFSTCFTFSKMSHHTRKIGTYTYIQWQQYTYTWTRTTTHERARNQKDSTKLKSTQDENERVKHRDELYFVFFFRKYTRMSIRDFQVIRNAMPINGTVTRCLYKHFAYIDALHDQTNWIWLFDDERCLSVF